MLKSSLRRARDAKPLSLFTAIVGTFCFVLSFFLACAVLRAQGNPAFLLIWTTAVVATTALTRVHLKWRCTFERIYAMNISMPCGFPPTRTNRNLDVEDVVFRELPG